jgi:NAD(P)-dependent dehydrogenase (short-subunit alcohol dehydrogenase family)
MADTLAELGADLLLVDRPDSHFTEVTEDITRRWDVMVDCIICDLEQESQRAKLIHEIANTPQELNILINNAAFVGTSDLHGWSVPFQEQTVDTWRRALEVNLSAVFDLCKGLAPVLARSAGASIINVSSIYGYLGPDWRLYDGTSMANPAAYAASKGGLIQFTRWLATTLAPAVRVNAISPGGVYRGQPEEFVQRYASRTPLGRMATEDDFRGAIAFLASDLSRYMTGQNLKIDGGWGIW